MSKRNIKAKRWALKKANRELNAETKAWPFGKLTVLHEVSKHADLIGRSRLEVRQAGSQFVGFINSNKDEVPLRFIEQMRMLGDGAGSIGKLRCCDGSA